MTSVFESWIQNEDASFIPLYIDQHPGKKTNAEDRRNYLQPRYIEELICVFLFIVAVVFHVLP